jgi:hypothetical protein
VAYDQFSGDVDAEEIYRAMLPMLKCPSCERLWVFWEGFAKPASADKLDSLPQTVEASLKRP